jgi:hypothetical protein
VRPHVLHFCIVTVLTAPAAAYGAFLLVKAASSHSDLAPIAEVVGGAVTAAALGYACLTTLIVLKKVSSVRGVLAVHSIPFGLAVLELARRAVWLASS